MDVAGYTNVIEDRLSGKPGNQPVFRRCGCASSHCGADSELNQKAPGGNIYSFGLGGSRAI